MRLVKRKKGFTLLEMIITIAILFITLALVSPLLNYNLKSLYTTENKNDLQREANKSLEYFTKRAMEAINISTIRDNSKSVLKDTISSEEGVSINEVEFSTGTLDSKPEDYINYNFKLKNDGKLIYTKKTLRKKEPQNPNSELTVIQESSKDIAADVKTIKVKPSNGETFEKCDGIKIQFEFSKHLSGSYIVTSEIKFRNK